MIRKLLITVVLAILCSIQVSWAQSSTGRDNTLMVKAAMDNAYGECGVIKHLTSRSRFSKEDVMNAALKVPSISESAKSRIRTILRTYPELKREIERISVNTRTALDTIMAEVRETRSVPDAISVLERLKSSEKYSNYKGFPEGIDAAITMLNDGTSSIYASGYEFGFASCSGNVEGGDDDDDSNSANPDSSATPADTNDAASQKIYKASVEGALEGAAAAILLGTTMRRPSAYEIKYMAFIESEIASMTEGVRQAIARTRKK